MSTPSVAIRSDTSPYGVAKASRTAAAASLISLVRSPRERRERSTWASATAMNGTEGCPFRSGSIRWTRGAPAALPFSHEWSVDCGISR
ncbi:hypothetical protein SUDANB51_04450 [Streptomyces sp. enrichment culture]